MGNRFTSFIVRRFRHRVSARSPASGISGALLISLVAAFVSLAVPGESEPGIIIYSTMDHARDEIAIAIPFERAEKHALVTNVTTSDGKTFRVTNNQLKQVVRPSDLNRSTVANDAALEKLRSEAASIRSMQDRYPRARATLEPVATRIEGMIQAIESGNVLVQGRLVPRADYEKKMAASAPKTIDIVMDGRTYSDARLSSVRDGVASIMHSGGVASIEIGQLSEDQIARLNETSSGLLVEKSKEVAVVPPAPEAAGALDDREKTDASEVTAPPPGEIVSDNPMPVNRIEEFATAKAPENSPQPDAPTLENAAPDEPVNPGELRPLLLDCRKDLATIQQGFSSMADLETFPSGRFGSMKYDEAMREANVQKARLNDAVETQSILIEKLRGLRLALSETNGLPAEIQDHVLDLADTREAALEEFIGVAGLSSEITVLLDRLDAIAPAETAEVSVQITENPREFASDWDGPGTVTANPSHSSSGEDVEQAAPVATASRYSIGWIAGGIAAVLLLILAVILSVEMSSRNKKGSNAGRRSGRDTPPGWLWPTVAGLAATVVVGSLVAIALNPKPQIEPTNVDEPETFEMTLNSPLSGADDTESIAVQDSTSSSSGDSSPIHGGQTLPRDYDQSAELERRMKESDRMQSEAFGVPEEEVRQVREAAMEAMMKELSR